MPCLGERIGSAWLQALHVHQSSCSRQQPLVLLDIRDGSPLSWGYHRPLDGGLRQLRGSVVVEGLIRGGDDVARGVSNAGSLNARTDVPLQIEGAI
jgi:hypothetical protein